MNNGIIQSILQAALEDEIPPSQVELWPAVRASLVAGNHQQLKKGMRMSTKKLYRMPRFAVAISMIVALLAVALLTPHGRAFSQSILQLFTRAESAAFPLQPSQIVQSEPDPLAPTAEPPSPLLSVAEAESQVGFGVAAIPTVPDGLIFLGARLYGQVVSVEYEVPGHGGHLRIVQSREGFMQSEWDRVPANVVVPVKIGELDGEFVQGTFVVYEGETVATWEPNAPILRLRWEKDGVSFEMQKTGNVQAIEYLDQARLIELAEGLTVNP